MANYDEFRGAKRFPDLAVGWGAFGHHFLNGKLHTQDLPGQTYARADALSPTCIEFSGYPTSTRLPRRLAHMGGQARVLVNIGKHAIHRGLHNCATFVMLREHKIGYPSSDSST